MAAAELEIPVLDCFIIVSSHHLEIALTTYADQRWCPVFCSVISRSFLEIPQIIDRALAELTPHATRGNLPEERAIAH